MIRAFSLFLLLAGIILLALAPASGAAAGSTVEILRVEGTIVPVIADYIDRGISSAESSGASAVIIELSTPGGLMDTTQRIVERILNAEIPVIVYVSPAGGWAGSAGTFITLAAHVAVMAPGSRIGAAHPVSVEGEIPDTMQEKVTEDAAAWIRSIAQLRGRDPDKAESAVRQSKSFSDVEALEFNLIDIRADNLADLFSQVDGRKVTLANGQEVTISTSSTAIDRVSMNWLESFLQTISDPNIALILLSVGSIGIIAEIYNPGLIFPGVIGGLSLIIGFYSLGVLNAQWGGILLIFLSFGLFILEMFVTSGGLLTAGGVTSLTLGSLILFSGNPSVLQANRGLIAGIVVAVSIFFIFVITAVIRGQRRKPVTGREGLVGQTGKVLKGLEPSGTVLVAGERWSATTEGDTIEPGEEVTVTSVQGLKLVVSKRIS